MGLEKSIGVRRWYAGGASEEVDEFEDEEFGERAAEVGDTRCIVSERSKGVPDEAYVASKVMYVPPMVGSAILAWNAADATNMMVFIKVE